jgi:hypothetical protein
MHGSFPRIIVAPNQERLVADATLSRALHHKVSLFFIWLDSDKPSIIN